MIGLPRLVISPRLVASPRLVMGSLACGILAGVVLSGLFLVAIGLPTAALIPDLIVFPFSPAQGLDRTIVRATPLILLGLAVVIGLRVRFWNIGVEGQLWMGAIAATGIAIFDIGPDAVRLPLMALSAAVAGGLWCLFPALVKVRFGASELILTLLLNYVAFLFVQHLLFGPWRDPASTFPVTAQFDAGIERLGLIGFGRVHSGVILALVCVLFYAWLTQISRAGSFMQATAANPVAGQLLGVPVGAMVLICGMLAGAFAGLAGFTIVAGQEYRLTQFVGQNYLFAAVLIAFLARLSAAGTLVAAICMAGLATAADGLKAFYQMPLAVVTTVQAILFLCIAISTFAPQYRILLLRPKSERSPSC